MAQPALKKKPLVSVITPFFNTASFLAECIESVLAQSYSHFEYILMDNCSTDGSTEIAAAYASRDPRIRLIRCSEFVPQLPNYNRALAEISEASEYCKIVQADDWIFPECLRLMVQAFEQSEAIGLVSSYWVEGNELRPFYFPRLSPWFPGGECARWYLRTGAGFFGTQTQVMYRSSLVRERQAFYNASFPFADLQKCMEILEHWDFGYVHQVLSFSRRENESFLSAVAGFDPFDLLWYIIAQRYAPAFLEADEAAAIVATYKFRYYRALARAVLGLRGRAFWRFHGVMMKALNKDETYDWRYLAMIIGPELLWLASNPGMLIKNAVRSFKPKKDQKRPPSNPKIVMNSDWFLGARASDGSGKV
jgi:glycosyltransferase involved in cell wall biosynthesis